jgi:hypothetical protein
MSTRTAWRDATTAQIADAIVVPLIEVNALYHEKWENGCHALQAENGATALAVPENVVMATHAWATRTLLTDPQAHTAEQGVAFWISYGEWDRALQGLHNSENRAAGEIWVLLCHLCQTQIDFE